MRSIEHEQASRGQSSDHFAAGSNLRLWNSVNKLAASQPELFPDYYGNPWLHRACQAWLGPLYQITAQVNVVVPGGAAQMGHRDYHLGFFPADLVAQMPPAVQQLSQWLTLQGAVVHDDVPLEKGPTQFVLGSQQDADGYRTYREPGEQARFAQQAVQIPLRKGDLIFFNPKIFHAAGSNASDEPRLVNLFQVSSGMAKPMEGLDFRQMVTHVYPVLLEMQDADAVARTLRVMLDAYPFPSNLDRTPPSEDWLGLTDTEYWLQAWRGRQSLTSALEGHDLRTHNRQP